MDEHSGMARHGVSRRTVVIGVAAGAATATGLLACNRGPATSATVAPTAATTQEATAVAGECVATAPAADASGVGLASLLVGGIVRDMPAGPCEVRISRFTLKPGTPFEAAALPYPSLMYIETGASDCPGGAGRIVYAPDGAILNETTGEGVQHISTGTTQYIPANVPDGAGNMGTDLMSSILIEFVPVKPGATPTG
jgi:hypothetical protein